MTPITSSSPTPVAHTLRRRRGLTEEAAAAAAARPAGGCGCRPSAPSLTRP